MGNLKRRLFFMGVAIATAIGAMALTTPTSAATFSCMNQGLSYPTGCQPVEGWNCLGDGDCACTCGASKCCEM